MAEVARRATDVSDLRTDTRERRKSGIFFFNRSFKRSSTNKGDGNESSASTPTTPTLGPVKDEADLKRTDSARSIPNLAQTAQITAEAEPLSASPKSVSLAESAQKPTADDADQEDKERKGAGSASEGLPTPPDTPGPASTTEAAVEEVQEDEAEPEDSQPSEPTFPSALAGIENRVSYHQDADLYIHARELDGADAVYSVRACVLETVSQVWKESLATRPSNTVDMVSDPAAGLDVIFSIAHYRFAHLPQKTDLQTLHDIAVAADRYQALHLLVPFIQSWLASLEPSSLVDGMNANVDKALVLSWILGDVQLFSKALTKCAYHAQVSPDGVLLDAEGKPWSAQPVSQEVLGLIAATRLEAIDEIIKAVSTPVNKLLNPQWYPEEVIQYCHAPEDDNGREHCEQLQLGSAIMGLSKAKLWPPPEASRIRTSAFELAQAYKDIRMRRYQVPGLRFQEGDSVVDSHATCGFGHHEAIVEILNKPAPLAGSLVSELLAHAKISGAFTETLFAEFEKYLPGQEEVAV